MREKNLQKLFIYESIGGGSKVTKDFSSFGLLNVPFSGSYFSASMLPHIRFPLEKLYFGWLSSHS